MRSDFYSLPWAAQQAIRRGERDAAIARRRAWTVAELQARVAELEEALTDLRLQALQSELNDPANEYGYAALQKANAALVDQGERG